MFLNKYSRTRVYTLKQYHSQERNRILREVLISLNEILCIIYLTAVRDVSGVLI